MLSLDLPMTRRRYTHGKVRPFVDGLLPEGEARRAIANDLGLAGDDAYSLIGALGRDCAGALVVQPIDAPAPSIPTIFSAEPLSVAQVADLVANLRNVPLGIGDRVRLSLAGVQEKLLLTRMPDGIWGRPVDGTPSTHILKPEIASFPNTIENEAFCMRFAQRLGLATANVETRCSEGHRWLTTQYPRARPLPTRATPLRVTIRGLGGGVVAAPRRLPPVASARSRAQPRSWTAASTSRTGSSCTGREPPGSRDRRPGNHD